MTASRAAREGGFALLAVLLAGGLLALLLTIMGRAAHTEGAVARNLTSAAQARAAADGAVRSGIFDLLADSESALRRDGSSRDVTVDRTIVSVAVQDLAGLVDLNAAPPELLSAVLVGQSQGRSDAAAALATAILARRPPPGPAAANAGPRPPPFRSVAELAALPGMSPELYHRLARLVTVISRQNGIDPHTAPAEILAALPGLDPQRVAETVTIRGTSPDAPRRLLAPAARFFIDSPGDAVAISAIATVAGITAERRAIVRLARGAVPPYRIIDWQAGPT